MSLQQLLCWRPASVPGAEIPGQEPLSYELLFAQRPFFLSDAPCGRVWGSPHGDRSPGHQLVELAHLKARDRAEVRFGEPPLTGEPELVQRLVVEEAEGFQEDRRKAVGLDDPHGFWDGMGEVITHSAQRRRFR